MKKICLCLTVFILSIGLLMANGASEVSGTSDNYVLKVGTTAPPVVQVSKSAALFGEKLSEVSGGKMSIDLCTSGTLGTTAQHYSQLEQGDLDMFVTAFDTETAMKDSKDFSVFVVPYAFDDTDHLRAFLETDVFKDMLNKVEKANSVKYMGLVGTLLPRALSTTKKPIVNPSDLKGLKIRTPESTAVVKVWQAWGASPIQTPGSEIYSSLESGLCDGQDNDVYGSTSTPLYEVQSYYMEINYIQQANVMWMSQKTWDKLNDQQKAWVTEAMKLADKEFSTDLSALYDEAKVIMTNNNVQFIEPDLDAFRAATAEVVKQFDGQLFSAGLYDYIRNMKR